MLTTLSERILLSFLESVQPTYGSICPKYKKITQAFNTEK